MNPFDWDEYDMDLSLLTASQVDILSIQLKYCDRQRRPWMLYILSQNKTWSHNFIPNVSDVGFLINSVTHNVTINNLVNLIKKAIWSNPHGMSSRHLWHLAWHPSFNVQLEGDVPLSIPDPIGLVVKSQKSTFLLFYTSTYVGGPWLHVALRLTSKVSITFTHSWHTTTLCHSYCVDVRMWSSHYKEGMGLFHTSLCVWVQQFHTNTAHLNNSCKTYPVLLVVEEWRTLCKPNLR